ncbi:MAG: HlyD family efflux transporter periplasmic adaptor subunit [Roseococcus sp.]|nr:HlyD family efflux transporter periplasmic adaptor subunit [Roseococcus sp.]
MTQNEGNSALGFHAAWPPAPRLSRLGDAPVNRLVEAPVNRLVDSSVNRLVEAPGKSPSLSFRSPSGKRLHPRVALPASVVIGGAEYALSDVSLGGFALEGEGPPAQVDDPLRVTFHIGKADLTLAIEATAKVRRLSRGAAKSFQIIEMSPDAAVALDRLVAIWLSGSESLADALSRSSLEAPEPAQSRSRNWRSVAVFGAALAALLLAATFVASSRLVVYSEFGAVSAPMWMVRAPQPGLLVLQAGAPGTLTEPGQVLGELHPALPPQLLSDTENQLQALEARSRQLAGELAHGDASFQAFRAQAEAEFAAASETRRLMERQVATQERLFTRLAGLGRQGIISAARVDQEEINLMTQRRVLAEASAAENAARLLLAEARAGRFRSDGRPTARSPEEVRREAAAVDHSLAEMRQTLARLRAPVPLVSPCRCRIAQVAVPSGTAVVAGDVLLGLAETASQAQLEVDALVPSTRMPFLEQGQRVTVRLAGSNDSTPGRITALNLNPENTGRIGLPDNLRSLRIYGLVTVALDEVPPGAAIGLPGLLQAPISLRMLLLNLPGFAWIARLGD